VDVGSATVRTRGRRGTAPIRPAPERVSRCRGR
jgi:hypothetical protein